MSALGLLVLGQFCGWLGLCCLAVAVFRAGRITGDELAWFAVASKLILTGFWLVTAALAGLR